MSNSPSVSDDDAASITSSVSSGWSEDKEYTVEEVLGKRELDDGLRYFVRWEGYPDTECSWEPLSCFERPDGNPTAADEWEAAVAEGDRQQDDEEIARIEALKAAQKKEKRIRLRSELRSSSNSTALKRKRNQNDKNTASRKKSKLELPIIPKSSAYKPPAQKFNTPNSNTARKSNRAPIQRKPLKSLTKRRASGKEGQLFKNLSTANRVNKAARREPNPDVAPSERKTVEEIDQYNAQIQAARSHDPLGLERSLQTVGQRKLEREAWKAKQNPTSTGVESESGEIPRASNSNSIDIHMETHIIIPPTASYETFADGKKERWGSNGRMWHPDEIVIDLFFGKNHIGDCKFQGLDNRNRGALLKCRVEKVMTISLHVAQVWTKREYMDTCLGRSNTVFAKGCVIPYDDTRAQLDEMANTLRAQNTAALFWHPVFDRVYVFYHLDCPDWKFFESTKSAARDDTKLRFAYRSGLPQDPVSSPDPTALAQRFKWHTLIDPLPAPTNETNLPDANSSGLLPTSKGHSTSNFIDSNHLNGAQHMEKPSPSQTGHQAKDDQNHSLTRQDPRLVFREAENDKLLAARMVRRQGKASHRASNSPLQTLPFQSKVREDEWAIGKPNAPVSSPNEQPAEVPFTVSRDKSGESATLQSMVSPQSTETAGSEAMDTSSRLRMVFEISIRWFRSEAVDTYVFYIMYPAAKKEEENALIESLEHRESCYTFSENTTNAFGKFSNLLHKPKTLGVILLHDEYRKYAEIPNLAKLLKSASQVQRSQRNSLCKINVFAVSIFREMGPSEYIERLFPYGMCILVTEATMRREPKTAIAILNWFSRIQKMKEPGKWKIILRPNIRPWLKNLLVLDEEITRRQLWADILLTVNNLTPYCAIRHVRSSIPPAVGDENGNRDIDSDVESVGNDGDSQDEDIPFPLISPRPIPRYGKAPSDSRVSQLTKDEHTMVEWFAGWAYTKAARYRNFIAVSTESLKEWRKWNHIEIVKPDQFMADMQIGENGESHNGSKLSSGATNSSAVTGISESKTPSETPTPGEYEATPKEGTPKEGITREILETSVETDGTSKERWATPQDIEEAPDDDKGTPKDVRGTPRENWEPSKDGMALREHQGYASSPMDVED